AEIVVRAPHSDLGADAVVIGARKPAAAPLEIGKDAGPPVGVQRVEALLEVALVIHAGSRCSPLLRWRVSAGLLARGGRGEVVDGALHPIAYTIVPHRRHR